MVGDIVHVGRKEGLVFLVNPHRGVGPPQEGLNEGRAVVETDLQLDVGFAGMEADAVHALEPRHGVAVLAPDGLRAVGVGFDFDIHRHEGGGAVMLRPVELYAAAGPRPGEADKRGLDDILAIEKIVAAGLIEAHMDAAADLRQDHHADELVLQVRGLPCVRGLFGGDPAGKRQWIDAPTAALVDALLQEHRILVGRLGQVRRNDHRLLPCLDRAGLLRRAREGVGIQSCKNRLHHGDTENTEKARRNID